MKSSWAKTEGAYKHNDKKAQRRNDEMERHFDPFTSGSSFFT